MAEHRSGSTPLRQSIGSAQQNTASAEHRFGSRSLRLTRAPADGLPQQRTALAEHWFGSELLQQMALRQEAASADDRFASDKSRRPNIEIGEAHGSKREPPQAVQEGSLNVSFFCVFIIGRISCVGPTQPLRGVRFVRRPFHQSTVSQHTVSSFRTRWRRIPC